MRIHLEECEEHRGLEWMRLPYGDASDGGNIYLEFCPDVEYMRDELYPDELVWVEP